MTLRMLQSIITLFFCSCLIVWRSRAVRVQGKLIDMPDNLLPVKLDSVHSISRAIQTLDSCNFCTGNEDERFHPLQAAKKGVFKDCAGNHMCTE